MKTKVLKTVNPADSAEGNSNEANSSVRWRRRKDSRPEEILKAALACFVETGFAATKLDEIAKRAGVSKGTLYLYFSSKEEIFQAVISEKVVTHIGEIEDILNLENVSAEELLRHLYTFLGKVVASSKISAIPKLVIAEAGNFPEITNFYYREVIMRGFGVVKEILHRGVKSGEFRKIDVEQTVYSIISPAIFAVIWKHSFTPHVGHEVDSEKFFQNHAELILHGLKQN